MIIWSATLDDLRKRREAFLNFLDQPELERMERFRFEADKERFLLGHGLLREVLGGELSCPPADLEFQRGPYGKPFIAGSGLEFNLSDTKDAVAIGVSRVEPIGVDIETLTRSVDHEAVGQHYFTPEEILSISSASNGKQRFLEFWTRKEAVLKASGVGIMDDLKVLRVDAAENHLRIEHEAFKQLAAPLYFVRTWNRGDDHIISLAAPSDTGPVLFLTPA